MWDAVRVRDEMTPTPLRQVAPDDDLARALALLGEHSIHQAPVMVGDRLVGLLTRAHVIRYLHSRGGPGLR
jgi:CBS domain-containing protein